MKIAVIQASTQIEKNCLLFEATKDTVSDKGWKVINFGVTADEENFSYIQISLCAALLINSGAVDYVVTGCSSGNGMAIACNALPNLIAGYLPTPADAFLFGRINHGNVASLPLGLNFGWSGEVNLRQTLSALFDTAMNTGYPTESAARKQADSEKLKQIKTLAQTDMIQILSGLDDDFTQVIYEKSDLMTYITENGTNTGLVEFLKGGKWRKL
ncbi:MAG: RpiB/LacA/LacB family sugar-phosphate isomerase [Streptococcaceae bacterium]|jgi:ribose 5-phosphate isomerase RpiB|nr:RpiB/LacA/LacB family sugar-phosphate isomerase [Streptococcaceae bacterium]